MSDYPQSRADGCVTNMPTHSSHDTHARQSIARVQPIRRTPKAYICIGPSEDEHKYTRKLCCCAIAIGCNATSYTNTGDPPQNIPGEDQIIS